MADRPALPHGVRPGGRFTEWRAPASVDYLVSDVDGTLIGGGMLPTDAVTAAVARATAAGVRVGLATGRMRDAVGPLCAHLTFSGPHLVHNGAEVLTDGSVIADWTLSEEQLEAVLGIAAAHPQGVLEIYTRSGYVATSRDPRAGPHWELLGAPPREVVSTARDLAGQSVLKTTYTAFNAGSAAAVSEAITALGLNAGSAVSPRTPHLHYVNATHPAAHKGAALRAAARHVGATMDRVAAVGDAGNDLAMFAAAGTAIAMGQADADVIAAAHLVVPGVDEDGLATALDTVAGWGREA